MRGRESLAAAVGVAQSSVGASAIIFIPILYFDLFNVQARLNLSAESLPLYMLILFIFGFFSVISGLFLLSERGELP